MSVSLAADGECLSDFSTLMISGESNPGRVKDWSNSNAASMEAAWTSSVSTCVTPTEGGVLWRRA